MEFQIHYIDKPGNVYSNHTHIMRVYVTNKLNSAWPALPALELDWQIDQFKVDKHWIKVEEIIRQWDEGIDFYSVDLQGNKAYIEVCSLLAEPTDVGLRPMERFITRNNRYIRTKPNGKKTDNLLSLPNYPFGNR